jgi:DHA2 family multidrug resistance protein
MLVFRAIQGAAGAGLVVWWRASIYLLLPKPQRSASLMRVSTLLYLSSAGGLLASGYLTDHASWRLIFVPDLLYAAAAICLLLRYFPTLPKPMGSSAVTDWPGIALIALALISLQVIPSRSPIDDWFGSPLIRLLAWVSAVGFVLFVLWQSSKRNPAPLLHLDLLRDRNVMSSALIGVVTGIILSGSLYVLPEFMRNIAARSLSATQTGQVTCVYALAAAAVRPLMLGFIARVGQRKAIWAALVMLIVSMLLFQRQLTADTPTTAFYVPLVLYALCLAPLLPAVGSGTVARIEQQKLLDGVSLYMTFRQFGASLGFALLTILIERRETLHSARLVEHLRDGGTMIQGWRAAAATILSERGGISTWEGQHAAGKRYRKFRQGRPAVPVKVTFDEPGAALPWISHGMSVEVRLWEPPAMAELPRLVASPGKLPATGRSLQCQPHCSWNPQGRILRGEAFRTRPGSCSGIVTVSVSGSQTGEG